MGSIWKPFGIHLETSGRMEALRGSRTVQEGPRVIWRSPGGAGGVEGALGGKATIFACYVQRIRNIDENDLAK